MKQANTILIIDDNKDIVEAIQLMLEDVGYHVYTGETAESLFSLSVFPDIILLDLLLSGTNGKEIIRQIKSNSQTRHIPIILNSAHPSAIQEWRTYGADDFIAKPFDITDLLNLIEKHLPSQ